MRSWRKAAITAISGLLAVGLGWGQQTTPSQASGRAKAEIHGRNHKRSLAKEDRRALLAVAGDARKLKYSGHDCSHLVHAIYQRAGFPYAYADSDDLYDGVPAFQRVARPQAGDLVVWHGHVGMVTRPSEHAFFSFLSRGPGTDDYNSRYWKSRGQPRFYRYLKRDDCAGCTLARAGSE